jgi:hypothetical protein
MTAIAKNLTTHVALVLDRSVSMEHLMDKTIQVADEVVSFLAEQSKAKNQEWRVSVYTFGSDVSCHIWDMDVLRLPSMKDHYKIDGNTALIDAVNMAIGDGEKITEHRGDHAFLAYFITDGEENWSAGDHVRGIYGRPPHGVASMLAADLKKRLAALPDNRTLAVLVPNENGRRQMQSLGFDNIELWDATTEAGMEAAAQTIKASTTTYMDARTQGAAGLRTMKKGGLFVGANVNAKAVKAANLTPLPSSARKITRVVQSDDSFEKEVKPANSRRAVAEMGWFVKIEDWVKRVNKGEYPLGDAFYELVKTERVQGDKEIAVVEVDTNKVFVGDGARQLLGLPDHIVSVKPDMNPDYTIFIQSNSVNRHLPHGSQVMVLKR